MSATGKCPLIHKLTDESPIQDGMKCPVEHTKIDEISDNPTHNEFKKLKRVMSTITKFYVDGTQLKKAQFEHGAEQLKKLQADYTMVEDQMEALRAKDYFKNHPKQKSYLADLEGELSHLEEKRQFYESKIEEFKGLYEWSTVIVQVCQWLEQCMEDYVVNELKLSLPKNAQPAKPPPLTDEQCAQYGKGLDEITYNLQESQDFFRASIDGRLTKYHNIEREIIQAQLDTIRKHPADSARRQAIEQELIEDLEFVESNMKDDDATKRRRQKMLQAHSEYFKVLKYYKQQLAERTPFKSDPSREYDPKYDFNPSNVMTR
mmetsp:Transcript_20149/g.29959  ORF Transcript_20149/g.29959 Transcript_20149/m.29959 type:complete len:318 (+) Transcript_20149:48-1001(+)|eukprot:CAMPEP_0201552946 /NCGR_PEP_ID=MMETSP0173_2-20130828/19358_1 /ASSEMBLY_ACC=CAM_ASM_000268 /TAXON_ID=218659 /ORGANISM="Vexillifera sp., Strain DIVA3 564/2" /LENGTH=317 /DNA_ID=CAMNT_0047963537 /DNA_START=48 /DNA_END=1001 /DNA_ORIENTATION=-